MNAATEFDVGPLTWVKSEIDLALERAVQALGKAIPSGDDTAFGDALAALVEILADRNG